MHVAETAYHGLLRKNSGNRDAKGRKRDMCELAAGVHTLDLVVSPGGGSPVNFDDPFREVHQYRTALSPRSAISFLKCATMMSRRLMTASISYGVS